MPLNFPKFFTVFPHISTRDVWIFKNTNASKLKLFVSILKGVGKRVSRVPEDLDNISAASDILDSYALVLELAEKYVSVIVPPYCCS